MAVVAVLLIHIERSRDVNPKAKRIRVLFCLMDFRERMDMARRWSNACKHMALARIKLPRKSMMMGLAKGTKASFTDETLKTVMSMGTSRAVMGIGIHSVTHQVTMKRNMAKRWCALGFCGRRGEK